tara:strand:+ start:69 stop:509 length:441 start_codon:yes stop_codon:yes gene_type:complete
MKINNAMRTNNRNIWSRRLAFQAIYSWSINVSSPSDVISFFKKDENYNKSDSDYFDNIVNGVILNIKEIDKYIETHSVIKIKNINFVELSILRIFIYEFIYHKKHPKQILLSESVKLANKFGGQDSYKFINAFLEKFLTVITYEKN